MTDYVKVLMHLVPKAQISYTGLNVSYDKIEWRDDRTQPSKAECDDAWELVDYLVKLEDIRKARQNRYLKETDGLFFDAMRTDQDLTAWTAIVNDIKNDLPYPTPLESE